GDELLEELARVVAEIGVGTAQPGAASGELVPSPPALSSRPVPATEPARDPHAELYEALAAWRRRRATDEEVPAFHVFANRVLAAIAEARPGSAAELLAVPGVGPAKLERYGDEVLEVVAAR